MCWEWTKLVVKKGNNWCSGKGTPSEDPDQKHLQQDKSYKIFIENKERMKEWKPFLDEV